MRALGWIVRAAGLAAALCAASFAAAQTTNTLPGGANSVQETFDDWTVACVQQNGAKRCAVSQQQADQQTRQRVIAIELMAASSDTVNGTLILPFGLALDDGVALQVDEAPAGPRLRFRTCLPGGCLVSLSFDAAQSAALRKGATLKVKATADGGKEADFTISLKGYPAAFDRMAALTK